MIVEHLAAKETDISLRIWETKMKLKGEWMLNLLSSSSQKLEMNANVAPWLLDV